MQGHLDDGERLKSKSRGSLKDMNILTIEYRGKLVSDNRRIMRSRHGMVINTKQYRNFKHDLKYIIRSRMGSGFETVNEPFGVRIKVWTSKDAQNLIKPVMDALEIAGSIKNDGLLRELYLVKQKIKRGLPEQIVIELVWGNQE